jgi:hypothetical protein
MWLGTLVADELECGSCLTHYVTVTCDLACKTFNRTGDLVYLATTTTRSKELFKYDGASDLKTTTPIKGS